MPTSFTSTPFMLESLVQQGANTLRLRYSSAPLVASSSGANDATNISNYLVSGPSTNFITAIIPVLGDPQGVDIQFLGPLATGNWTVTVANVKTVATESLSEPKNLICACVETPRISPVTGGAVDYSVYNILRSHLSPAIAGDNVDAVLEGLAGGDQTNVDNVRLGLKQLFRSSASGVWLDRQASAYGIQRPSTVGISDDLFRKWVVRASNHKITADSILEVLEVFYGSDAVRASVASTLSEPFNITDGMDITFILDEKDTIHITFAATDFINPQAATAQEIAVVITQALLNAGSNAFATPYTDPSSGVTVVKVYSGALGLRSSVRVSGGSAQYVLRFPTFKNPYGSFSNITWNVTKPNPQTARFTTSSNVVDLSQLLVGDYVVITGLASQFNGSFPIQKLRITYSGGVVTQYFDVSNSAATVATITQTAASQFAFYSSTKGSVYAAANRTVVVAQTDEGGLDIVLPATTQVVSRTIDTGAYAQVEDSLSVTGTLTRDGYGKLHVTTSAPNALQVGSQILIDNARPSYSGPAITPYVLGTTGTWDTSNISMAAVWSPVRAPDIPETYNTPGILALSSGNHKGDIFYFMGGIGGTPSAQCQRLTSQSTQAADGSTTVQTKWVNCSSAPAARYDMSYCLMADGRVFQAGGFDNTVAYTNTTFIYDPDADQWSTKANLPQTSGQAVFVPLSDGTVFIAGLSNGAGYSSQTYIYDPTFDSYTPNVIIDPPPFGFNRGFVYGAQLPNGKIFLLSYYPVPAAFIIDTSGPSVTFTGMPDYSGLSNFCQLPDGRIVALGGFGAKLDTSDTGAALSVVTIYDWRIGQWLPLPSISAPTQNGGVLYWEPPAGTAWPRAVLVTGKDTSHPFTEMFDIDKGVWRRLPDQNFIGSPVVSNGPSALLSGKYPFWFQGNSGVPYGGFFLIPNGSFAYNGRAINGRATVTQVNTSYSFVAQEESGIAGVVTNTAANVSITPVASTGNTPPGPYAFSPDEGPALTGIESTTAQDLVAGMTYRVLSLNPALPFNFPDADGWLCFDVGGKNETFPVKYIGVYSSGSTPALLLDMNTKFSKTIPSGSKITLLASKNTFAPTNAPGSFYLTASNSGRVTASSAVDDLLAGGIPVNKTIIYPGDRGLGGEGRPTENTNKLSDKVAVWGGNNLDIEIQDLREGIV